MENKSVLISVISIILVFLLFVSTLFLGLFPIKIDSNKLGFTIPFDKIENVGVPQYIEYRNKPCVGLYAYCNIWENPNYNDNVFFTFTDTFIYLVYDIEDYNINSQQEYLEYFINGGRIHLTLENCLYGCVVPQYLLPVYFGKDYIYNYLKEEGSFPPFYEIYNITLDSYLYLDSASQFQLSYSLPEDSFPNMNVKYNSKNVLGSFLNTLHLTLTTLEFPHFDYKFTNIVEIVPLVQSISNYIGSVADYFKQVFSCITYSFTPLLWFGYEV